MLGRQKLTQKKKKKKSPSILWYKFQIFIFPFFSLTFLETKQCKVVKRKKEKRLKFENYQVGFLRRRRFERNDKNLRNLRSFEVATEVVGFLTKTWLEAKKMRENENSRETLKRLRFGSFFLFFIFYFYGRAGLNLGILCLD